jgi:hypothetical protein
MHMNRPVIFHSELTRHAADPAPALSICQHQELALGNASVTDGRDGSPSRLRVLGRLGEVTIP